jgi:acyl-CoA reductase-like NAD-dependent aldehyde dehydrogenase
MESPLKLAEMVARPNRFFIGGEWVEPSSAATFDVVTPSTEEIFGTVAEALAADMARAVEAARTAFDEGPWPRLGHAERAGFLTAIAAEMRGRASDLAASWTSEMGVVQGFANVLIPPLARVFDFHADLAGSFPFEEHHVPERGGFGLLVQEPVGVVAAIVPWNFPLMLVSWKIAPALLAGCTVVLKASPEAPTTPYILAEIAEAVGLPKGVLNVLTADREVSEQLVRDPRIDKVTFTGSSAAGKRIAAICGERIARYTLELGGKSAAVICADCDLDEAVQGIAMGARLMTGQVCSSLTRIVVTRDRHDRMVESLAAAFAAIRVGDPFDAATGMGPLAMARQRERVEGYIAKGRAEGAKLVAGGRRPRHLERGFFLEPTLFANVSNDMTIAQEEIFGPVLSVIPADDEQHAIRIANASPYGLNAAVFTGDPDRAYRMARQIRSGSVGQNGSRTDFTIGFGGFKQSGFGREGGVEGLRQFLETKTIVIDAAPAHWRDR